MYAHTCDEPWAETGGDIRFAAIQTALETRQYSANGEAKQTMLTGTKRRNQEGTTYAPVTTNRFTVRARAPPLRPALEHHTTCTAR